MRGSNNSITFAAISIIRKRAYPIMKCPKCNSETLAEFKVEDVSVDRCSSCDGIWLDGGEFEKLFAARRR